MTKLYDGQLTDFLLNDARYDPKVMALSYAVLQEKHRLMDKANGTRTLAVIDELPEHILDLLSVELRTPFYDEAHPIQTKRDLIKRTFIFYQYMGTPEAVNQMVSAVFPGSYIEEWFTYGGEPYHFQVIIEMSRYRITANAVDIKRAVYQCKRLSAHMDGIIYQCTIGLVIRTSPCGYLYDAPMTGTYECGTQPWRSMDAALSPEGMAVRTRTDAFSYDAHETGTYPWRNKEGGLGHGEIEAGTAGAGTPYDVDATGTVPWRNKESGMDRREVRVTAAGQGFSHASIFTGQAETGTVPWRNMEGGYKDSGLGLQATADGHAYNSEFTGQYETGTVPFRNTEGGVTDGATAVRAETEPFLYAASVTGRKETGETPVRNTEGGEEAGAFFTEADGEGFAYHVRMCGETYCGQDFI